MPKIRDLGINVIPVTMRPPEIGPGGGYDQSTCNSETNCSSETCDPSGQCVPSCDGGSRAIRGGRNGFSAEAIAQLKQQLRQQL